MTTFLLLTGFFLATICGTILTIGIPYHLSKLVDREGRTWKHRISSYKSYHRHHKH